MTFRFPVCLPISIPYNIYACRVSTPEKRQPLYCGTKLELLILSSLLLLLFFFYLPIRSINVFAAPSSILYAKKKKECHVIYRYIVNIHLYIYVFTILWTIYLCINTFRYIIIQTHTHTYTLYVVRSNTKCMSDYYIPEW